MTIVFTLLWRVLLSYRGQATVCSCIRVTWSLTCLWHPTYVQINIIWFCYCCA